MKKTVQIQLNPLNFIVEGNTEQEMITAAKEAFKESLQKTFPNFTYSIFDADCVKIEDVKIGDIVEVIESKRVSIGIVIKLNPGGIRPITVYTKNGITISCPVSIIKKSDASFEEARYKKNKSEFNLKDIYVGDTGYLKHTEKESLEEKITPVVVAKVTTKKIEVHTVPGTLNYFSIPIEKFSYFVKENESDFDKIKKTDKENK